MQISDTCLARWGSQAFSLYQLAHWGARWALYWQVKMTRGWSAHCLCTKSWEQGATSYHLDGCPSCCSVVMEEGYVNTPVTCESGHKPRPRPKDSQMDKYHCPHKHYRPNKILGALISVEITAWLPTKMFPELFCQDYRNYRHNSLKLFRSCGRYWLIDAGQSIMRQADSVSYCWTLWLQRVTFPVPEDSIPECPQIPGNTGNLAILSNWMVQVFPEIPSPDVWNSQEIPEISKLFPTQKGGRYMREIGAICPFGSFSLALLLILKLPLKTQCFQGRILPILAPKRTPSRLWFEKVPFVTSFPMR